VKLLYLSLALGCCLSCNVDLPDRKLLIDELYNEKVEAFKLKKDKECKAEALADAEAHVDSFLYIPARLIDTLGFPDKPIKPQAPGHIIGKVKKFSTEEQSKTTAKEVELH